MTAAATVREVLFVYLPARQAYERLISTGINQQQARNTTALLLWLEQTTAVLAIRRSQGFNAHALSCLIAESNSILECLRAEPGRVAFPEIPFLSSLSCRECSINPAFFVYHQGLVVGGVAAILDGIGPFLFDENLYRMYHRFSTGLVPPYAALEAPFSFRPHTVPEDYRAMFITFSRGQPLEREEIFDYFRQKWGDCIVRVLMEKTTGGAPPMYGRIIFKSDAFVSLVLNGTSTVKITINNRQIWLRRYVPRDQNGDQQSN